MRQNLEGNQAQASEIPHPMKSQRKHSIPLAMNCDDTWECCLPGNQRSSTQGFLLEAGHKTTCYFAYNKISESQRKTGLMQIPLLHTKTLLSFKERRDLFQSSSSQESTEGHLASRTFSVNSFLYNCLGRHGGIQELKVPSFTASVAMSLLQFSESHSCTISAML